MKSKLHYSTEIRVFCKSCGNLSYMVYTEVNFGNELPTLTPEKPLPPASVFLSCGNCNAITEEELSDD